MGHAPVRFAVFVGLTFVLATPASASGFANVTQSATAAGVANAGTTAYAANASTVFYNPAGMTQLSQEQIVVASGFVAPHATFENTGTVDATGGPVLGGTGVRNGLFAVPSIFAIVPLDRWRFGVGVYSPFGQSTKYDDDWVGRYHTVETTLRTAAINTSVAYQLTDALAVGGSLVVEHAKFIRKSALDFGSICFGTVGPATCAGLGLFPQSADGRLKVDADDWAVSSVVGAVLQPAQGTRLGLAYRSAPDHDFSGTATFTVPPSAAA
jgi:long-chain fatty acid transport protein